MTIPRLPVFVYNLERTILRRIPEPDANRPVPLISFAIAVGGLYVGAIVAAAIFPLCVAPSDVLVYAAGIIGVGAFLLALPALGYAVRTDATSAKTLARVEREAERELAEVQPGTGLPTGSEADLAALPPGTVPDPAIKPLGLVSAAGTEYELISQKDVPPRVFGDLLSEGERTTEFNPGELVAKLDYVAREPGRGNKPWLFGFDGIDEVWQITYGGKRKKGPTLKRLAVPFGGKPR
jgi:hypothetical protein